MQCKEGEKKNSKGKCYKPKDKPTVCVAGQKKNSNGKCYTPNVPRTGPSCDARSTIARGSSCACRYKGMRKVNATRCACTNGLPPVRGVGCVKIKIERGGDGDAAGTGGGRNCVTVLGVKKCF